MLCAQDTGLNADGPMHVANLPSSQPTLLDQLRELKLYEEKLVCPVP